MAHLDTRRDTTIGATERMVQTLVIERNVTVAEELRRSLEGAGFDVAVVHTEGAGLTAAARSQYGAVVLGIPLPDLHGLEVVRAIRALQRDTHLIVVSKHLTIRSTAEAMKSGADDVIEEPVSIEPLVGAVTAATSLIGQSRQRRSPPPLGPARAASEPSLGDSVAHRWATYVLKASTATDDLKTLAAWARHAGTSSTMISESCSILGIKAHNARDLSRALSAMLRAAQLHCPPSVLLDVADSRTLRAFRQKAGPEFGAAHNMDSISTFLDSQRFVEPRNYGMTILRTLLSRIFSHEFA